MIFKENTKLKIDQGVIWVGEETLNAVASDAVARANNLAYAESFVQEYSGKEVVVDQEGKIIHEELNQDA